MDPFNYSEDDFRLTMYPIKHKNLWDLYIRSRACFWVPNEIELQYDSNDYKTLSENEQQLIDFVLAFFASADSLVNLNLLNRFTNEVKFVEAIAFYAQQLSMEVIHSETYSQLIQAIIPNQSKRDKLFNSIKTIKVISDMANYIQSCTISENKFGNRLLRMACVEGIFFSGCFCVIYWLSSRGLMPGLSHSNELIVRDETLHTVFALELYNMLKDSEKLSVSEVQVIFKEACELAFKFIEQAMPKPVLEMNPAHMKQYIEYITDKLLSYIHIPKLYDSSCPFLFMLKIDLINRTNFFERRVSEYSNMQKKSTEYINFNF